jgi:putative transposase
VGKRRSVALTIAALQRAIRLCQPPAGVFFRADCGVEYGPRWFKQALTNHGFIHSMNRPGSMNDNAHMESFFHTLKLEGLYKMRFDQAPRLSHSLRSYFTFYNQDRLHSSLAHQTPGVFDKGPHAHFPPN